jgi:hypothetical protein
MRIWLPKWSTVAVNKKLILISILTVTVLLVGGMWVATRTPKEADLGLDDFAKCLADKNLVMYGAYWCSHCQAQKKLFGSSVQYIKYIECTQETKLCTEKEITGYPTWIATDGTRYEGEQSLQKLSEITSCPLPE